MPEDISSEDLELLGALGVDAEPKERPAQSPREQRIIAGFEEIERFVNENGRAPEHGEGRDIFERLYAVRLDRIRQSPECIAALDGRDPLGLLKLPQEENVMEVREDEPNDEALLEALGVGAAQADDITRLKHVKPKEEPEEVAQRVPCKDFSKFKPLFEKVQRELAAGIRKTLKYRDNAEIKQGELFVVEGQKAYVAEVGEQFTTGYGRPDSRLRVIYDNGTESDLLLRSLQRALNRDDASRRITDPDLGPLFSSEDSHADDAVGHIYVLRSKSDHPFISQNRAVIHKIGVTTGSIRKRLANAAKDPTFLLADVELVGSYKLSNLSPTRLEKLIHRFFARARLDVELSDRFAQDVEPREWFLAPLSAIDEAIRKLVDGTIGDYRYDPEAGAITPLAESDAKAD